MRLKNKINLICDYILQIYSNKILYDLIKKKKIFKNSIHSKKL